MQGTWSERALLFHVVFVPEARCGLQKSGRFRAETSAHFVTLRKRGSSFNVRQPTTSSTKDSSFLAHVFVHSSKSIAVIL
jgi:hypothetical protein